MNANLVGTPGVFVTNDAANPVPTMAQGTTDVNVVNIPTVAARQQGAWMVDVSGTPIVTVGNAASTPVLVRDVDNSARNRYNPNGFLSVNLAAGQQFACGVGFFHVPAGKRLVIEYVSGRGSADPGQNLELEIFVPAQEGVAGALSYDFLPAKQGPNVDATRDLFVLSQPTRLYAAAGNIQFCLSRGGGTSNTASFAVSVSGHLVDCGMGGGCPIP